MAFVSGSANSVSDLLTALQDACVGNGYTLSGSVLHKGTLFLQASVASGCLKILGGTGINGSNQLTGAGPAAVQIGATVGVPSVGTWPVFFSIHVLDEPDEVYLIVNSDVDQFHWLAFGVNAATGITGSGVWYGGTEGEFAPALTTKAIALEPVMTVGGEGPNSCPALFFSAGNNFYRTVNSFIHHNLDDVGWSGGGTSNSLAVGAASAVVGGPANAARGVEVALQRQPNSWNQDSILLPIRPLVPRASLKCSQIGDLAHSRYIRVSNYEPGEVITLGSDRWRVYPWFRKNASTPNGGSNITHSGTLGWAVRYDGP